MKIGILRETTHSNDPRVALTPRHAQVLLERFPSLQIVVQPSNRRIFSNKEYLEAGIEMNEDISACDILLGVKEVSLNTIIQGKNYLFFAHVAKKQTKNQTYFQGLSQKKITLIDYEYLVDDKKQRIIAFGYWAGITGCYYATLALLKKISPLEIKTDSFYSILKQWNELTDQIELPPVKFLITGSGQSAKGASKTLEKLGVLAVKPEDFHRCFTKPVFTVLKRKHHMVHKQNRPYSKQEYQLHPELFQSELKQIIGLADVYLACHYWEKQFPKFLLREDFLQKPMNLKVIADITCDVNGSVASTIRESTHKKPFYDYNPESSAEEEAFSSESNITVMAIGNLPALIAREASIHFSELLTKEIIPKLLSNETEELIAKATILKDGKLSSHFLYLYDYLNLKS
ncbi:MAG: hypothetical protein ACERKD_19215 [Prolixibacteraceae bacterium]